MSYNRSRHFKVEARHKYPINGDETCQSRFAPRREVCHFRCQVHTARHKNRRCRRPIRRKAAGDNGETTAAFRGCSIWSKNDTFQDSDPAHEETEADAGERGSGPDKRHRMGVLPSSASRTKAEHVSLSAKGRQRYKSHKVNKHGQNCLNELVAEKIFVWGSWDAFLRIY